MPTEEFSVASTPVSTGQQQVDALHGEPVTQGYQVGSITVAAYGSVTSPAAGGVICTLGAMTAGNYEITVYVAISGTVATADTDNMHLNVVGGGVFQLLVDPVANGPLLAFRLPRIALLNTNTTITAIATATVGAVYRAVIVATPLA